MKKQSPIIKILLFPINLLKYEVLGIYYTLYALLYPFIFIFNKIGDKAYSKYEENVRKNSGVKEMVEEEVNLDSGTSAFKGEEKKEIKGVTYWIGHTPQYVKVAVRSDCDLQNRIENVKGAENLLEDYLTGELCGN